MYKITEIQDKLKKDIGEKRYQHSKRVADTAKKLAENFGINTEKAYYAGLIHDCAKYNEKLYIEKLKYQFLTYLYIIFHCILHKH